MKWLEVVWQMSLLSVLLLGVYYHAYLGLSLAIILLLLHWVIQWMRMIFHHDR